MTYQKVRVAICVLAVAVQSSESDAAGVDIERPLAANRSAWSKIVENLGSTGLNGSLALRIPLPTSPTLDAIPIKPYLEHHVDFDMNGAPKSVITLQGLRTFLARTEVNALRWYAPGRDAVRFTGEPAFSLSAPSRGWRIRAVSASEHEIRSGEGMLWRYKGGALTTVFHPAIGQLRITTRGANIEEVWTGRGGMPGGLLLGVSYDHMGRIVRYIVPNVVQAACKYDGEGRLVAYEGSDGTRIAFEYRENMLSAVNVEGGRSHRYTWTRPSSAVYKRRWPALMHLASDDDNEYQYDVGSSGYRIVRRSIASQETIETLFNPRQGSVTQTTPAGTITAHFKTFSDGRARLQTIVVPASGLVLEKYEYDDDGRLTAVSQKGLPTKRFDYDEDGRMTGAAETPQ